MSARIYKKKGDKLKIVASMLEKVSAWTDCERPEPKKETTAGRIERIRSRKNCHLTKAWCAGVISAASIAWPANELLTFAGEKLSWATRGETQAEIWAKQARDLGAVTQSVPQQASPIVPNTNPTSPLISILKGISLVFGIAAGAYGGVHAYDVRQDKKKLRAETARLNWEDHYHGRKP